MAPTRILVISICVTVLAGSTRAAELPVATASGVVKKTTANVLLVSPRGADGRFRDTLVLKLHGTSRIFLQSIQEREGESVVVQRAINAQSLESNQPVAVIYVVGRDEYILLAAVARVRPKK